MAFSQDLLVTLLVPSAASATVYGNSTPGLDRYDALHCVLTCAGLVGGTLDLTVQHSWNDVDWYDAARIPQIAAGAASASYSFGVTLDSTIRAIRKGTVSAAVPVLATNTVTSGPWGKALRLVAVTGAGTSGASVTATLNIMSWQSIK